MPRARAARTAPLRLADAADDHDQEGGEDVGGAGAGPDRADQRHGHPGHAGQAGAEEEGGGVDPGDGQAADRGQVAVLHDRPHPAAGGQLAQEQGHQAHRHQDHGEEEQPGVGHAHAEELGLALQERRRGDLLVVGREEVLGQLLEDEADAEGDEQGVERPARHPPQEDPFEHHAHEAGDEEGDGQGDDDGRALGPLEQGGLQHEGHVGPGHDEFAVGHVDDAHLAEGEGESQPDQQEERGQGDPDVEVAQEGVHRVAPR